MAAAGVKRKKTVSIIVMSGAARLGGGRALLKGAVVGGAVGPGE